MSDPVQVVLKAKRDRVVRQRHPWLFSGAIAHIDKVAQDGQVVDVTSSQREWLARGYLNRRSQINVRLLTWEKARQIDTRFWEDRLARAWRLRGPLQSDPDTTMFRVVNAESDGIPGLIVDRYGAWVVVQSLTLGIEKVKMVLVDLLRNLIPGVQGIYERSDVDVREKEGLDQTTGVVWGEEPPPFLEVLERGHRYLVYVRAGHKTGFYIDQRDNRLRLEHYCRQADVLNAFSYSGAFAVCALAGGARSVTNVDTSTQALELARRNVALNDSEGARVSYLEADVFAQLRAFRAQERQFDVVILDPPRFAAARSHLKQASRGYKDINWIALQILRPGGTLFTFSCSGVVSRELFQKIIFGAALDANRDVQIIGQLSQASDHPIAVNFPEAEYLKGFICRAW
jgi:23S rRNA (cytosine1962-C5)-methyltransferase